MSKHLTLIVATLLFTTTQAHGYVGPSTGDLQVHGYVVAQNKATNQVVLVNTTTMQITATGVGGLEAVLSTDGRRIAYAKKVRNGEIWVMNNDGTGGRKVADCVSGLTDGFILSWTEKNNIWWSEGGDSKDKNMYRVNVETGIKDIYWSYEPQSSASDADGIYKLCVSKDESRAASMVHGGGWGFTYDLPAKAKLQEQQGGCNGALTGLGTYYMTGTTQGAYIPDGYHRYYSTARLWDAVTGETVAYITCPGVYPGPTETGPGTGDQIRNWRGSHHTDEYMTCTGFGKDANGEKSYLWKILENRYLTLPDGLYPSDFWPGDLPGTATTPTAEITLSPTVLTFDDTNADASQVVQVTNDVPGTTLGPVTATAAGTSPWLTLVLSGSGNTQTITVSVDITGLNAGAYQAQVSVSGGGAAAPASFSVNLNVGTSLPAPTALTAVSPGPGQVDLTWTDNSDNESAFMIERRLQDGQWEQLTLAAPNATSYTDATVTMATWEYRVKAVNGADASGYSNVATVSVRGDKSITILNPTAATPLQTGTEITIRWQATDVTNVNVLYSLDDGENWVLINTDDAVSTTDPRWGNLPWTVPSAAAAALVILIHDYSDANTRAQSQAIPLSVGSPRLLGPAGVAHGIAGVSAGRDGMRIALGETGAGARLTVHNLTGELVADLSSDVTAGSNVVSVRRVLSAGWYVVRLRGDGSTRSCPFAVQ